MKSRRQFLKTAGVLATTLGIPGMSNSQVISPSKIDYSSVINDDELFNLVRTQLLIPKSKVYLNTGSLGPSPLPVIETVSSTIRQLEADPVSENWGTLGQQMEMVRSKLADFIHATQEEVLLTRNTTEGLGLIAQSFNFKPKDEILTTTQEHDGALVGMEFAAKNKGVIVKKVNLPMPSQNKQQVIDLVESHITSKTKAIVLSHINTMTGMVMPFTEIAEITRSKGILLVADGAQAPGLIKVDVAKLGVDAYAASGHKWLLGPKETGFLYLNKRLQPEIQGLFNYSGFASYSASSGTRNVATIIGLGAAIDFLNEIGVDRIQNRCLEIRNYCFDELKKLQGLRINSPEDKALSCGIVSFALLKASNKDVYAKLKEKDIIVKLLSSDNSIRISCHMFVSKEDIDKFIGALKHMI